jgi:hypothetical protein
MGSLVMTVTTADPLALTDDEVASLAVSLREPWRAPLPTVDRTSSQSFAEAVLRGRRSLVLRNLATSEGSPAGPAAELARKLKPGLRAFFLLADQADNWLPGGVTVYLYGPALDAIDVNHTVTEAGVHYFRLAPPPGQWAALTQLAESVAASGFPDQPGHGGRPQPAAAFLFVIRPEGTRSIRVAKGSVTTGRGPVPARFPSVTDGVAWLLA